jgi:hypothetical protein
MTSFPNNEPWSVLCPVHRRQSHVQAPNFSGAGPRSQSQRHHHLLASLSDPFAATRLDVAWRHHRCFAAVSRATARGFRQCPAPNLRVPRDQGTQQGDLARGGQGAKRSGSPQTNLETGATFRVGCQESRSTTRAFATEDRRPLRPSLPVCATHVDRCGTSNLAAHHARFAAITNFA